MQNDCLSDFLGMCRNPFYELKALQCDKCRCKISKCKTMVQATVGSPKTVHLALDVIGRYSSFTLTTRLSFMLVRD